MFEEMDYRRAACAWCEWRDDYEHGEDNLPMLNSFRRFFKFCTEWNVPNWQTPDSKQIGRLFDHLGGIIPENAGVDALADAWQRAAIFRNRQISLASKLVAFRVPSVYIPMDRYSKNGLALLDNGPANFNEYNPYLIRFNLILDNNLNEYDTFINEGPIPTNNNEGFKRRVFDCALMRLGGRWP
jgi:hypothetical protein